MKKLNNIEIDLLLRIDFFALTKYGERDDYSDEQFEIDKDSIKTKYRISNVYKRESGGYEYVRLADIGKNIEIYEQYLRDLKSINSFFCCQLEQAIGLFQDEELKIFFSTDSGSCFDTKSHLSAIEESYILKSVEDWMENGNYNVNTFFGKRKGNKLIIQYSPNSNNIDTDNCANKEYELQFDEFLTKVNQLKPRIKHFYKIIKERIVDLPEGKDDDNVEQVFNEKI